MELNNSEAAALAASINPEAGSSVVGEIDLYRDLIAFAELSPEEQRRLADRPVKSSEETAAEHAHPEAVRTDLTVEPGESELTAPSEESISHSDDSNPCRQSSEAGVETFEASNPSGAITVFSLTPNFVFTGALSRGVCLACGAESVADDLFCISCGVFIDEIAPAPPFNPTCGECGLGVRFDEVFCPWCGSVPAA